MDGKSGETEGLLHRRSDVEVSVGEGGYDERKDPEGDPANIIRGAGAVLHPLAIEACEAEVPFWVEYFLFASKVLMTFGLAPSLWRAAVPKDIDDPKSKLTRSHAALVDLFSLPNLALGSHYWNVGLAMSFLSTPVSYYLVDTLNASAAVTNTYTAVLYLPWCLKVFIGLFSDSVPIGKQHRKPYFILGWATTIGSCVWLACYPDPSIPQIQILSFTMTMGYLSSDVVADALVVERSISESRDEMGSLRTEAYIVRSVGGIVGAVLGAVLYNTASWGWGLTIAQCFLLQALIVIITLAPSIPWLLDTGSGYHKFSAQIAELWHLVQRRTVWWPLSFVYMYSVMQISNPAWTNFLVDGLNFDDLDLGVITIASAVFAWIALYVYKAYFFDMNWQHLYYWTTLLNVVLSALQLLLVYGETGGLPKLLFAAGDYAFITFAQYIQFMPMLILALAVIPGGIEGASYAMITTCINVAYEVGYSIGTSFTGIWNVSDCNFEGRKFEGMAKLTILTSLLQLSPVVLIWMFPTGKQAVFDSLKNELISETAGTIFVFVLFASILGTMIYSVAIIYDAGDDDDGGCGDDSSGDDSTSSMLFKSFFRLMKSR